MIRAEVPDAALTDRDPVCRIDGMGHEVLDHTADTGIEATADSLSGLVGELSTGMFRLMAAIDPTLADRWISARVEATSPEDLVVDCLSELLYRSEVEDLLFCDIRVTLEPDTLDAHIEAGGVPSGSVDLDGPPIKAVTLHDLAVEERADGWYGRVYFDV